MGFLIEPGIHLHLQFLLLSMLELELVIRLSLVEVTNTFFNSISFTHLICTDLKMTILDFVRVKRYLIDLNFRNN